MLRYPVNFVGITQYYSDRHKGIDLGWKDTPDDPVFAACCTAVCLDSVVLRPISL